MRVEPADSGPLTWDPVLLSTERVQWCFDNETAGADTVGGYTIRTKDWLVQIVEGVRHLATAGGAYSQVLTMSQGWGRGTTG